MKLNTIIFIFFSILTFTLNAQNYNQAEDSKGLYWQPDVKIDYSHFQSVSNSDCIKYNKKYGLKMSATIEIKGIVDIPKSHLSKKIKKRKGYDKVYLAPMFCKNCSCILSEDSIELIVYQLLFDVAEVCTRDIRIELKNTQKQMNINNVNTMFFITVKNKWEKIMREIWGAIYNDVLIQKKEKAYVEWRKLIDKYLKEKIEFATQPNDIKRLILEKPIEKNYIQAKHIVGNLKTSNEN